MRTFKTIPERGDFGFQQLVGPHKVTGAAMAGTRGFFGLHLSKSSPFGSVRDEEGNIYSFVRSLMAPNGTPNPTRLPISPARHYWSTVAQPWSHCRSMKYSKGTNRLVNNVAQ